MKVMLNTNNLSKNLQGQKIVSYGVCETIICLYWCKKVRQKSVCHYMYFLFIFAKPPIDKKLWLDNILTVKLVS